MHENKFTYVNIIKAAVIFVLSFIAVVFLFAAALYFLEGGFEYSPLFATLALACGTGVTSFYLGNIKGEKGIIIGAATGGTVIIIATLATLLVNSGTPGWNFILRIIIVMLSSLIGAIIGVNKKANKKYI